MKNKYMEYKRSLWKGKLGYNKSHNRNLNSKNGICIYHVYPEPLSEHAWWDDFGFYINGVYHAVWWVHPRMKYSDEVDNLAYDACDHLYNKDTDDIFGSGSTPMYRKVGKSRKKVSGYVSGYIGNSTKTWYDALQLAEKELVLDNSISVVPSMKVEWLKYGKGIELCYPVELVNEKTITEFALEVKSWITSGLGMPTMENVYTKEEWIKEGHIK